MLTCLSPLTVHSKRLLPIVCIFLGACTTFPSWLPSSGPSVKQVLEQPSTRVPIRVIDVTDDIARTLQESRHTDSFLSTFPIKHPGKLLIGPGDVLEISAWEAPPATLFSNFDTKGTISGARQTLLPEQTVNSDGLIQVPFAGMIAAAGKTTQQIEAEIVRRLTGKANQPQVLVRVAKNVTQNVTVVGEVFTSLRLPLTAKGERLLDAIASAGGVRTPTNKTSIQLSRNGQVLAMPLDSIINEPRQNILLQAGDVITALSQSFSFTALGATGKNEEVNFEVRGISLAQALGRIAGVNDSQADASGLFIFRFESQNTVRSADGKEASTKKIPVIYRLDLKDPRTFLIAQNFPMQNKDVVYVSNAPAAELQKFLNILTSSLFSVNSVVNLGK